MKYSALLLLLLFAGKYAAAQTTSTGPVTTTNVDPNKALQTPTQSNITYQTLSQFFQSSVTNGANGGFDFKSSLFGIEQLFKGSSADYSSYYTAHKFDRNFQVALGIHKNQSGSLSMLTGGITYSPINERSKADSNFDKNGQLRTALIDRLNLYYEAEKKYIKEYIDNEKDPKKHQAVFTNYKDAMKKYNTTGLDSVLPKELINIRDTMIVDYGYKDIPKYLSGPDVIYKTIAKKIDMGSLLTFAFNPGYDYNHQNLDSTSLNVTYLVGFGNPDKPYNLDVQGSGLVFRDTLLTGHNTSRHELIGKLGLNKTLVQDDKSNPLIEFELQFEDDNHLNTPLYKAEENNQITANTVLTVHLSSTLSLPVTLKYDLKKPNLLGVFNLTWNFQSSKSSTSN